MREKLLIFLFLLFFIVITLESIYYSGIKGWEYPFHDPYINIIYAENIVKGIGWRIYSDTSPFTAPSDYLLPILHIPFVLIGIKNIQTLVFIDYIIHTLLLIFTSIFIFKVFKEYFKFNSVILFLPLVLHPLYFFSYFFALNTSFFSFFFWGTIAYLKEKYKFIPFLMLLAFTRPESPIAIIFIFSISWFLLKNRERFYIGVFSFSFLLSIVQFILNYIITGFFTTMGVRPQFLLLHFNYLESAYQFFRNMSNQLKAFLIGFPSYTTILKSVPTFTGAFTIPFLGVLSIIGLLDKEYRKFYVFFLVYFLIILIGDSITVNRGLHLNRHFAYLYPFFMFLAWRGIAILSEEIPGKKSFNILFSIFSFFVFLAWFETLTNFSLYVKKFKLKAKYSKEASQFIPEGEEILTDSPYFFSKLFKKYKIHILSHYYSPLVSKYCPQFGAYTERSEIIQDYYSDVRYFYHDLTTPKIPEGILAFSEKILWKSFDPEIPATLYKINLTPLKKEHYLPSPYNLFWELDVGNPISEFESNYRWFSDLPGKEGGFLQKGVISNDTIWDGGRVINKGWEVFKAKVKRNGKNYLVIRTGGHFEGMLTKIYTVFIPYSFDFERIYFTVKVEDKILGSVGTSNVSNFTEWIVEIPQELVKNKDEIKVEVRGNYISYHYFIYTVD